jgi:hypothetical protein
MINIQCYQQKIIGSGLILKNTIIAVDMNMGIDFKHRFKILLSIKAILTSKDQDNE